MLPVLLLLSACSRSDYVEGGLYYTEDENGTYSVLKILKIDDGGYHVRLYSNQFTDPPQHIDEHTLYVAGVDHETNENFGMGHLPLSKESFAGWNAKFIQQSNVSDEELEGYTMWRDASGGYF